MAPAAPSPAKNAARADLCRRASFCLLSSSAACFLLRTRVRVSCRMGRGKARSFFTRFSETHHLAARDHDGFRHKNAFENAFLLALPILQTPHITKPLSEPAARATHLSPA